MNGGWAWYNEIDEFAAQWLRNLIARGLIAPGTVDTRSIVDVRADEIAEFRQCHFFAGIGGWSLALRLAGWGDDCPVWTGSCPCQPFSSAGRQRGFDDARHLWPVWLKLIRERRPATVFGEQVASATEWLRLVRSDLEALGYAVGAIPIEAAGAGADHRRDRYWLVADGDGGGRQARDVAAAGLGYGRAAPSTGGNPMVDGIGPRLEGYAGHVDTWPGRAGQAGSAAAPGDAFDWYVSPDGKVRRAKSGIRLLADGIPGRVGKLRGFGNAIDPRPASEFIKAAMEVMP